MALAAPASSSNVSPLVARAAMNAAICVSVTLPEKISVIILKHLGFTQIFSPNDFTEIFPKHCRASPFLFSARILKYDYV